MIKIQQIVIVLMIIFISSGNYACNSAQSTKDTELVKQINEMLDKIAVNPVCLLSSILSTLNHSNLSKIGLEN